MWVGGEGVERGEETKYGQSKKSKAAEEERRGVGKCVEGWGSVLACRDVCGRGLKSVEVCRREWK